MAEKSEVPEECNISSSNGIPSNEEVIEDLTKDLKNVLLKETEGGSGIETVCDDSANKSSDNTGDFIPQDFDKDEKVPAKPEDDFIDEEALKDAELTYTEDDRKRLRTEAEDLKCIGNDLFKAGKYVESAQKYTEALRICPLAFDKDRAILYSNRAAAKVKLNFKTEAIEDCTKAVTLDSTYLKAFYRRAQLYEETDKLDEALADYQTILQLDPLHREALYATKRLPDMIQERNEKLKADMLAKLKDLGNMILRPFNLSTDNFQVTQDPSTGGYSVSFQQNRR
ncbi:tetratricopeptide repeat protein 1 [Anabrus simplex]|uniref:tetratricopeptide repeat protein 1 n=1 Tax=Anabrus simplex TaxID=316456 RepID=UPI0035A2B5E8